MRILTTLGLLLNFIVSLAQGAKKTPECEIDSLYKASVKIFDYKEYNEAIQNTIKAIDLSRTNNNTYMLSKCYLLLGNFYFSLRDNQNAKLNLKKAMSYAVEVRDSTLIYKAHNALGNVETNSGKNIQIGVDHYHKALHLTEKLKDTIGIVGCLTNLGWTYLENNKKEKAYSYLLHAYNINNSHKNNKKHVNADLLFLLGKYHYLKKEYNKSVNYLNQSLVISSRESFLPTLVDVYNLRSKVYKETNQLNKAYSDVINYSKFNDSLLAMQRTGEYETAKSRFALKEYQRDLELANKEKEVSEIEAENNKRKLLFSIILSVFALIVFYFYSNNKIRKRDNNALLEKNKFLEDSKKKLDHLNQLKTQFISTVSHELRTPLYGIIGITNILSENNKTFSNEHKNLIKSLEQSSNFLLKHINDVLRIGEIESRDLSLESTEIETKKFLSYIEEKFKAVSEQTNNKLHIDYDTNLPFKIQTDQLRLKEVLVNLLDNAFKFTTNGNIWFRVTNYKNNDTGKMQLLFEVEDDGIGISEDKKEIIFDKFYQANRGQKNLDGTGLGLSVVKYLLHNLNTKVHLESESGKGSKFYFYLNIDGSEANSSSKIAVIDEEIQFIKRKILIAEDNKISQAITKKMVTALGHECVVCDNGLETLNAAKEEDFDLVLMDLNMPVMDGIESARLILEHKRDVPIVALTALDLGHVKEDCYSAGMLYAVNKPLNKNDLSTIINEYSMVSMSA